MQMHHPISTSRGCYAPLATMVLLTSPSAGQKRPAQVAMTISSPEIRLA